MKDTRAAIYCRISNDPEGLKYGIERQAHDCRQLAERLGLTVVEVFDDNNIGASAASRKERPDFERMLAEAREKRFTTIIAYSSSRLTRRPRELEDIIDLHKKHGTDFKTVVSGDFDLSTASGMTIARILGNIDAGEAAQLSERLKAANAARARQGLPFAGGMRTFGWNNDRITLNKKEAALVRKAVKQVTEGYGLTAVANDWNAKGMLTVRGNPWTHTSVSKLLANPRIAGIRTHHGEVQLDAVGAPVIGQWEAIVSPEEHEALLEAWGSRKKERRDKVRHFLGGKVVCGRCRGRMHGSYHKNRTTYICRNGDLGVTARRLDLHVLRQILIRMVLLYQHKALHGDGEVEKQEWSGQARLDELTANIQAMMEDYYESPQTRRMLLGQVDKLRAEADALGKAKALWKQEQVRAVPIEPLTEAGMGIGELFINTVWSGPLGNSEYLTLVEDYIEEVMIRPTQRGARNVAERAEIMWTPAATPWGQGEPPALPKDDAQWLADYYALVEQEAYKPGRQGSQSPHLPRVLEVLRSDPTISVKDMAEQLGVSVRMANRVMVHAKGQMARDRDFVPEPAPREQARQRFVRLAELMRDNPAITGQEVCGELGISSGYASKLMASVRKVLAANPDHDFATDPPSTLDDRRGNKRLPVVLTMLRTDPDLSARELAERLEVGQTYAQQLLKAARTVAQKEDA